MWTPSWIRIRPACLKSGMPAASSTRPSSSTWIGSTLTRFRSSSPLSAVTLAELAAGPHAADESDERARRQDRLQRAEAAFEPLPVDAEVARAYGRVYSAVAAGRRARKARAFDLLIAATALAAELPLYTRNEDDFRGLGSLGEIVPVELAAR
jgi:predicted nucleic acid-binding protein